MSKDTTDDKDKGGVEEEEKKKKKGGKGKNKDPAAASSSLDGDTPPKWFASVSLHISDIASRMGSVTSQLGQFADRVSVLESKLAPVPPSKAEVAAAESATASATGGVLASQTQAADTHTDKANETKQSSFVSGASPSTVSATTKAAADTGKGDSETKTENKTGKKTETHTEKKSEAQQTANSAAESTSAPTQLHLVDAGVKEKKKKRNKQRKERGKRVKKANKAAGLKLVKRMLLQKRDSDTDSSDSDSDCSDDGAAESVALASGAVPEEETDTESESEQQQQEGKAGVPGNSKPAVTSNAKDSGKPAYKVISYPMTRPLPGSRKIPKWIWRLKRYALPQKSMGSEWYAPGVVEKAFRQFGSVSAWADAKIRSKTGSDFLAQVFDARVHAQIIDCICAGDLFQAIELSARRLHGIRRYIQTGDIEELEVMSFEDVDDCPVSPEEQAIRAKAVAAKKKAKADKRASKSAGKKAASHQSQSQSPSQSQAAKPGANPSAKPFTPGQKRGGVG